MSCYWDRTALLILIFKVKLDIHFNLMAITMKLFVMTFLCGINWCCMKSAYSSLLFISLLTSGNAALTLLVMYFAFKCIT